MGSFDKSYHDILKKYVEITEQRYQVIDTTTGKAVGFTDQPPTQPAVAQTTQTSTPAADQIATTPAEAEPSEEQKKTFQRLHGTPYNPKSQMDKNKMQVQRQAETASGGDFNKLKQVVYSGNNVNPLNAGKPGQPTGSTSAPRVDTSNQFGGKVNLTNTGMTPTIPKPTTTVTPPAPIATTTTTSTPPKPATPTSTTSTASPKRNRRSV